MRPITLKQANKFVDDHHRHHKSVQFNKFSVAVKLAEADPEIIVGCAIVGRPVNRVLDDGFTLEISRLCIVDP